MRWRASRENKAADRGKCVSFAALAAEQRRRGVAAGLIRAALHEARWRGWQAVFVLGNPAYYGRFDFTAAAAAPFASRYAGPYLLALALGPEGLPASSGGIAFASAFDALD